MAGKQKQNAFALAKMKTSLPAVLESQVGEPTEPALSQLVCIILTPAIVLSDPQPAVSQPTREVNQLSQHSVR